jgi:FkbM family methyltransferase
MKNAFALDTFRYIWSHPNCKNKQFESVGKFLGWQIYKRAIRRPLDFDIISNVKIRCYSDSRSSSSALYCGLYDFNEMNFLLRYLRPEDTFLDVGANIGIYTLLAASCITQGSIYSFEALPKNCERLRQNLALNKVENVNLHNIAVADREGSMLLNLAEGDSMPFLTDKANDRTISVQSNTLNNLLQDCNQNIEGAELIALRGAIPLLQKHSPPVWILEILDVSDSRPNNQVSLLKFLQEFGYGIYNYDALTNKLTPCALNDKQGKNVLAIAAEKLSSVYERITG